MATNRTSTIRPGGRSSVVRYLRRYSCVREFYIRPHQNLSKNLCLVKSGSDPKSIKYLLPTTRELETVRSGVPLLTLPVGLETGLPAL